MISLIVAASTNNAIGKNGQLLWHLPSDLQFFKNTTWGMPVIMGRKTFESVNKVLPGRINIVITSQPDWKVDAVIAVQSLDQAIAKAQETNCKELFVIGGGEIYKQVMETADKIYMTRVHEILDGDTFFPELDETKWEKVNNVDFPKDEKHAYSFSIQTWLRHS